MARTARPSARQRKELPAPLPPETRTVGQVVAEALRLYGRRFWAALALGLSLALLNQLAASTTRLGQLVVTATVGAVLLSCSFAGAAALAAGVRPRPRTLLVAVAVGSVLFVPVPFLALGFVLPAIAWLAFVGLAVPVVVIENRSARAAVARAVMLARADYVHALGSLATLAITYFLTRTVLLFLLRGQADNTLRAAAFLADLVVSPILFLGASILYFDQAARVVSSAPRTKTKRRRSDANLHHAHDTDGSGRPDAEVEPRAAARGQP